MGNVQKVRNDAKNYAIFHPVEMELFYTPRTNMSNNREDYKTLDLFIDKCIEQTFSKQFVIFKEKIVISDNYIIFIFCL